MKAEIQDGVVTVTVSRRNLRALLAKLDGAPSASACTIQRSAAGDDEPELWIRAEEDDVHYGGRGYPPGAMHPDTEAVLAL